MGLTLVEKIAARHVDGLATGAIVRAGDFVSIRPRHVMTHDNTGAVIPKFKQIGATSIADPAQPVFAIDHDIQNTTPKNLEKYAKIEAFARDHGIDFYPAGTGISHQVMVEQGYVVPGALVVARRNRGRSAGSRPGQNGGSLVAAVLIHPGLDELSDRRGIGLTKVLDLLTDVDLLRVFRDRLRRRHAGLARPARDNGRRRRLLG